LLKNLNLSAFAVADLHDGSTLAQASVDYYLSAHWSVGAIVDVYSGARQSEFGSLPQRGSALLLTIEVRREMPRAWRTFD
jgi:hypothetical protein